MRLLQAVMMNGVPVLGVVLLAVGLLVPRLQWLAYVGGVLIVAYLGVDVLGCVRHAQTRRMRV